MIWENFNVFLGVENKLMDKFNIFFQNYMVRMYFVNIWFPCYYKHKDVFGITSISDGQTSSRKNIVIF